MGLQETFDRFLADMKLEGKADMTLVEYANRLSRFKKYLIRHKKALNEVKHDDIVEFTREMFKNNLNSTTKNVNYQLYTYIVYGQLRTGYLITFSFHQPTTLKPTLLKSGFDDCQMRTSGRLSPILTASKRTSGPLFG